jgi:hypothetical protein
MRLRRPRKAAGTRKGQHRHSWEAVGAIWGRQCIRMGALEHENEAMLGAEQHLTNLYLLVTDFWRTAANYKGSQEVI